MVIVEKQTKDMLTASKIGCYAINPYVGCPHACKYCYASFMKLRRDMDKGSTVRERRRTKYWKKIIITN